MYCGPEGTANAWDDDGSKSLLCTTKVLAFSAVITMPHQVTVFIHRKGMRLSRSLFKWVSKEMYVIENAHYRRHGQRICAHKDRV